MAILPLGSQPVQRQTDGSDPTARTTPETFTKPTKPRQHLSRRQRKRKERDLARQEQRAVETRPPLQQTPAPGPAVEAPVNRTTDIPPMRPTANGTRRQTADGRNDQMVPQDKKVVSGMASQTRSTPQQQVQHAVQAAGREQIPPHVPARVATHTYSYPSSLFVPGRVGGRNLAFLVDTGCTHNLLSRTVFDRLPAPIRQHMKTQESTATMADGSGLPIYGSIRLEGRLRNTKFVADFLVCRISDDGILGMSFLREQDCSVACDKGLLVMRGTPIPCTDKMGRLLSNKVQVVRTLVLPPEAEAQVCCRLNSAPSAPIGLIESLLEQDVGVAVAATLGRPSSDGSVLVRCWNLSSEPQELRSGSVIGLYQPVEEEQVEEAPIQACSVLDRDNQSAATDCPEHVLPLLHQTR